MEKTKLMFNTFLEWRKENDVDNIIEVSYYSKLVRIKEIGTQKKFHCVPNYTPIFLLYFLSISNLIYFI